MNENTMFDLKGFGKPLERSSHFRDIDINRFYGY